MSKLFRDPTYERMQESEECWLELAIEPFYFKLNDKLALIPERIEFGFDEVIWCLPTQMESWSNSIYIRQFINLAASRSNFCFNSDELDLIKKLFKLEFDPELIIDLEEGKMSGPIVLVKTQPCFSDDEIPGLIGQLALTLIRVDWPTKNNKAEVISRMNEIQDIIGCTSSRSSKRINSKLHDIRATMYKILSEDQWKIRNDEIAYDACGWISVYCSNGRLDALMNLTRLKCMTHKGNPIYSMEEL